MVDVELESSAEAGHVVAVQVDMEVGGVGQAAAGRRLADDVGGGVASHVGGEGVGSTSADGHAVALEKLGGDREVLEVANRATAHLFIVQPIKKFEARAKGMFSTHPPIEDRIERLKALLR